MCISVDTLDDALRSFYRYTFKRAEPADQYVDLTEEEIDQLQDAVPAIALECIE